MNEGRGEKKKEQKKKFFSKELPFTFACSKADALKIIFKMLLFVIDTNLTPTSPFGYLTKKKKPESLWELVPFWLYCSKLEDC